LWGDGSPKRELMYVDDLASACLYFLSQKLNADYINVGSREEYTIKEYAKKISKLLNFKGNIKFDSKMPNGTKKKLLDSTLAISYGWSSSIKFDEGIMLMINDIFVNKRFKPYE